MTVNTQYRNVPAVTTARARRVALYLTDRREGSFKVRYLLPPFRFAGLLAIK